MSKSFCGNADSVDVYTFDGMNDGKFCIILLVCIMQRNDGILFFCFAPFKPVNSLANNNNAKKIEKQNKRESIVTTHL